MFLGEFQHALDEKGRIILPSKFRARLSEGCVLTIGQDRCLYAFPLAEWERVAEQLRGIKVSNLGARNFQRLIFSHASEEMPDRQGRVMVPESLRRYAGLEREVMVLGAGPRIEIWDRARWVQHREEAAGGFSEMAEAIEGLPW